MPVAVLLANLPIFIMDKKFRMLALADNTSGIYCRLFGFKVLYCFFSASNFNIPATIRVGYDMMSF